MGDDDSKEEPLSGIVQGDMRILERLGPDSPHLEGVPRWLDEAYEAFDKELKSLGKMTPTLQEALEDCLNALGIIDEAYHTHQVTAWTDGVMQAYAHTAFQLFLEKKKNIEAKQDRYNPLYPHFFVAFRDNPELRSIKSDAALARALTEASKSGKVFSREYTRKNREKAEKDLDL